MSIKANKPITIDDYASWLTTSGTTILSGAPGTFWVRYESGAMVRIPTFYLSPPDQDEIQQVQWGARAAVVSYLLEPDECHPANALLYVCADQEYSLEKLSREMRWNVRRGHKELRIAPLTSDQVLAHGFEAYRDTRRRAGLNDGTPQAFSRLVNSLAKCPAQVFLGAWKDDKLAAFRCIREVDDWAESVGGFSTNALLHLKPNDTLDFTALYRYLREMRCRLFTIGLSSIQGEQNMSGLHTYKIKLGYEARPVHRVFVIHPLLRPFTNRLTLWGLNLALKFNPADRRLRKARGVLACMLGVK